METPKQKFEDVFTPEQQERISNAYKKFIGMSIALAKEHPELIDDETKQSKEDGK